MKSSNLPEAIIFDWDNTLVDTWDLLHISMNDTLRFFNMSEVTIEEMKQNTFRSMKNVFPSLFKERWIEAAKLYRSRYSFHSHKKLKLLPNALKFLKILYDKKNIYTGIVSNKSGDILRNETKLLKVEKYFKKIVGSGDAKEDKPSLASIIFALDKSGMILSENIWYIGDTEADMNFAREANCKQVFFGCDINAAMFQCGKPSMIFNNYREIISFFKKNLISI